MASNVLTDLTLCLHAETGKAVLVSETGEERRAAWLPKSQVEVERTGKITNAGNRVGKKYPVVVVTLPEWMAINKGLA